MIYSVYSVVILYTTINEQRGINMNKIKNEDLGQEVFDLFDSYVHSKISRREFMEQVSKYAFGGVTAAAIYEYLAPKYAEAQQIKANDPRLRGCVETHPQSKISQYILD